MLILVISISLFESFGIVLSQYLFDKLISFIFIWHRYFAIAYSILILSSLITMINFHRGGLTPYTKCQSYPFIILMSCLGIGTLYPVFFAALIPLSYINFRKAEEYSEIEALVTHLEEVKEKSLNIMVYHSWTENAWQITLQMYVLVDESKTLDYLIENPINVISILISLASICRSFSMVVVDLNPGRDGNFGEIFGIFRIFGGFFRLLSWLGTKFSLI